MIPLLVLAGFAPLQGGTSTLDFEGFPDSTIFTNQYPGLTFSNTMVLTAGITLNEFEFPPRSGTNVVSDHGGPMAITFNTPVASFSGFFTHGVQLTMIAFDSLNHQIASVNSHFSNNEALSGNSGSSPNELMVSSGGGITRVTIAGDPTGTSFTLDDATISTSFTPNPTPLPPTLILTLSGLALAGLTALAARKRMGNEFGSMKMLGLALAVLASFGIGTLWLSAAPQTSHVHQTPQPRIDSFSANQTTFRAKTPTPVTLAARITNPAHISNSVNLIRIDPSGVPSIVGQMHDDGKNGDAVAGDHTYTFSLNLNEGRPGLVRVQVSTAFRGRMRRVLSDPLTLIIKSSSSQ